MAASLSGVYNLQNFSDLGALAAGFRLYTYAAGTTTQKVAYTDQAGTVPHTYVSDGGGGLYIALNSRGELPAPLFLTSGGYDIALKTSAGATVWSRRAIASSDASDSVLTALADTTSAANGPGLIGYDPELSYLAATVGGALNDSRAEMLWFITDETERANIKAGTSSTNHTATIQAALALIGARELHFGDSGQWNINATLTPVSGQTLSGRAKIRAINAAAITGAMVKGTSVTRCAVRDLELDANAANNGANYGVWFASGTRNLVENVYVHDTAQAGAILESEDSSRIVGGQFINCGRATSVTGGGATDNHGIMVYSIGATPVKNCSVRGARVSSAYRKGITTYSANPGTLVGVVISDNMVDSCGVTPSSGGGIYLANAVATTDQDSVTLTGNVCWSNYVNFEIANCKRVAGGGNVSRNSVAQGVVVDACADANLPGFQDSDAGTDGILLNGCTAVVMGAVSVRRANRSAAANGAGLHLASSTYCTVAQGSVVYDETPLQKYAVLEDGTSNNNDLFGITTVGALTSLWSITGAATRYGRRDGRNTGVNQANPQNTWHINGGLTFDEQAITLVNGANQNVALPSNAGVVVSNAPTANYSIGGIAGGHAGRHLTIINYTGFSMTLNHQDASSTAANRITLRSSANLVIPTLGSATLVYSTIGGGGAWFVKAFG